VGFGMRIKEKQYCDYCGKFVYKLSKKQMKKIEKARLEGTRLCYVSICRSCKNEQRKKKTAV
jgi:hypothetical protein